MDNALLAIPVLHWLLLAGAGWLLMWVCFVGWHIQKPRKGSRISAALDVAPVADARVESERRAA